MSTQVKFDWTWTGYVGGVFLGEPYVSVTCDVTSDGEVFVTGVTIIEGWKNPPEIKVCLDESDDAFALALFAKIKADLEIEQAFIERALDKAGFDDDGDNDWRAYERDVRKSYVAGIL